MIPGMLSSFLTPRYSLFKSFTKNPFNDSSEHPSFRRHGPRLPIVAPRPNAILAWRQNALGIQRVLDRLVQLHLRIVVEAVRVGDLVHECEVRAVLAPALVRGVGDEGPDKAVGAALRVRVRAVEDEADDVVHLAHADDEGADEVEAELAAAALGEGVLEVGVGTGNFGDRGEEEVCLFLCVTGQ